MRAPPTLSAFKVLSVMGLPQLPPPPPTTTTDDDDEEEEEMDEPDSDDDDVDGQGAHSSGGGAGGGAKAVELPHARIRIGRVFVPDSWKSGDVLRGVGADGGMLDLAPSGELLPGQMVTFELP